MQEKRLRVVLIVQIAFSNECLDLIFDNCKKCTIRSSKGSPTAQYLAFTTGRALQPHAAFIVAVKCKARLVQYMAFQQQISPARKDPTTHSTQDQQRAFILACWLDRIGVWPAIQWDSEPTLLHQSGCLVVIDCELCILP